MNIRQITDNVYVFWFLLALPTPWMLVATKWETWLSWTGLFSCWMLIVTMAITPLQMALGPLPWLRRRRRYIGVASFAYACLHLLVWLASINIGQLIRSFTRPDVLPGWLAMPIMVVLAATSFDLAVRKLGPRWKQLQRWVYPAAVLTLIHWWLTAQFKIDVVIYCTPLILLEVWRVYRNRSRRRRA